MTNTKRETGNKEMPAITHRPPKLARRVYIRLIDRALPIPPRTEAENRRLLAILRELEDRDEPLTPEEESFSDLLAIVIGDFEDKHVILPKSPPHEVLKYLGEERGLK